MRPARNATPTIPRGADSAYNRHESGGPGYAEGALWTTQRSPLIDQALERTFLPDAVLRELAPPLPQIERFPARWGYDTHQPTLDDVLSVRRWSVPYAPVGQDGGAPLATSQPSLQSWW